MQLGAHSNKSGDIYYKAKIIDKSKVVISWDLKDHTMAQYLFMGWFFLNEPEQAEYYRKELFKTRASNAHK